MGEAQSPAVSKPGVGLEFGLGVAWPPELERVLVSRW